MFLIFFKNSIFSFFFSSSNICQVHKNACWAKIMKKMPKNAIGPKLTQYLSKMLFLCQKLKLENEKKFKLIINYWFFKIIMQLLFFLLQICLIIVLTTFFLRGDGGQQHPPKFLYFIPCLLRLENSKFHFSCSVGSKPMKDSCAPPPTK